MAGMKLTPEKLSAFCTALAETCNVGRAAEAVGISRFTAYTWRKNIPEFATAWDDAMKAGLLALEDEAHRRAFDGTDKPVFHQGQCCGTIREYSDTLAIFLLKAHDPAKYRENTRMELTNPDGSLRPADDTSTATRLATLLALATQRRDSQSADGEEPGADLV